MSATKVAMETLVGEAELLEDRATVLLNSVKSRATSLQKEIEAAGSATGLVGGVRLRDMEADVALVGQLLREAGAYRRGAWKIGL